MKTTPFLSLCGATLLLGMVPASAATSAGIPSRDFGQTPDGQTVTLYTLTNANGVQAGIMTYGATVVNLIVPDRQGHLADVALGFDTFAPYLTQTAYFGCVPGRYANRIAKGRFTLDGKIYQLPLNNGLNTLHGGFKGFDKRIWKAQILPSQNPSVQFSRLSPDGEEGYPGNLQASVTYTLTPKNDLKIVYEATTDKPTVVNLTNHTYFNLAGAGNGTILNHLLTIKANAYTPVDATLIPTGLIQKVKGTVMDFRTPMTIGSRIQQVGGTPVGYDHNYVLRQGLLSSWSLAAKVVEPKSGRVLTVYTDQPGVQFYSGNFLDGTLTGKGGKVYPQYSGFCLETQHFPDSPNEPKFPSTVLKPGQVYRTETVFAFGTD